VKSVWAETGAPSGHKILPDGVHLVCDASQHAVLRVDAHGKVLDMRLRSARASLCASRTT